MRDRIDVRKIRIRQIDVKKVNSLLRRHKYAELFKLVSKIVYPQGLNAFSRYSRVNKAFLIRLFRGKNLPRLDRFQALLEALDLEIIVRKKKRS